MGVYVDISLAALVTVFIVDLSGFTRSWKGALGRWLKTDPDKLRVRPFDCSLCMTWWATLIVALAEGSLTFGTTAFCALCALLADTMGATLVLIKDLILAALDAVYKRIGR